MSVPSQIDRAPAAPKRRVPVSQPMLDSSEAHFTGGGGLEAARCIKARWPEVKIIILTVFDQYLDEALAAGADGYLLKGGSSAELREAIHRVAGTN